MFLVNVKAYVFSSVFVVWEEKKRTFIYHKLQRVWYKPVWADDMKALCYQVIKNLRLKNKCRKKHFFLLSIYSWYLNAKRKQGLDTHCLFLKSSLVVVSTENGAEQGSAARSYDIYTSDKEFQKHTQQRPHLLDTCYKHWLSQMYTDCCIHLLGTLLEANVHMQLSNLITSGNSIYMQQTTFNHLHASHAQVIHLVSS